MPWLTTYGAANKVEDGTDFVTRKYTFGPFTYEVEDEIDRYRYVGMTSAAADTCQAAVHDPSGDPAVYAQKERENNAGAFQVSVSEVTFGTATVT